MSTSITKIKFECRNSDGSVVTYRDVNQSAGESRPIWDGHYGWFLENRFWLDCGDTAASTQTWGWIKAHAIGCARSNDSSPSVWRGGKSAELNSSFVTWTRYESTFQTSTEDTTEGFVSFDKTAESGSATLHAYATYDEKGSGGGNGATVYARPNANYAFIGWYVDGEEVVSTSGYAYVSASDPGELHLSAAAIKDEVEATAWFSPTFKVKFNHNRSGNQDFAYKTAYSTSASRTMSVVDGVEQRVPPIADIMARNVGHRFVSWTTAQDGGGTSVADNGDVSGLSYANPGDQVNIWGQWAKCDFTVSASSDIPSGAPEQEIALAFSGVLDGVTSSTPNGDDGETWRSGTLLTITAPAVGNGVAFGGWTVTGVSNYTIDGGVVRFTVPEGNVSAVANYAFRELAVTAVVDDASTPAVADGAQASIINYSTGQAFVGPPRYGDKATFTAPQAVTGYSFSGWYSGVERVSTANPYANVTLTADAAFVAKYKKSVDVFIDTTGGGAGTVSVGGSAVESGGTADIELGSSVAISATVTSGYFGGWLVNGQPVALDQTASLAMTDGVSALTAKFASAEASFTVTCLSEINGSGDTLGVAGTLAIQAQSGVTDNGDGTYTVSGYRQVTLVATPSTAAGARPLYKIVNVTGAGADILVPSPQEDGRTYTVSVGVSSDVTFKALWGYKGHSLVTVESADTDMGDVFVGSVPGVYSDYVVQDTEVVAHATPYNGFRFVGWFVSDPGAQSESPEETLVSESMAYAFTASADTYLLLARFEPDECVIFEWEGSDERKVMEWESRTYTLPKPFDPVAARVDAAEYPVALTVATRSSPDSSEVRSHEIVVASQDGRRLPRMRPERFLSVRVEASVEVDAVVVGTNMAEVN